MRISPRMPVCSSMMSMQFIVVKHDTNDCGHELGAQLYSNIGTVVLGSIVVVATALLL
jgi:hypothetical protein